MDLCGDSCIAGLWIIQVWCCRHRFQSSIMEQLLLHWPSYRSQANHFSDLAELRLPWNLPRKGRIPQEGHIWIVTFSIYYYCFWECFSYRCFLVLFYWHFFSKTDIEYFLVVWKSTWPPKQCLWTQWEILVGFPVGLCRQQPQVLMGQRWEPADYSGGKKNKKADSLKGQEYPWVAIKKRKRWTEKRDIQVF